MSAPRHFTLYFYAAVLEVLAADGVELLSIEAREHNLERLFLELTGRKLRDS